MQLRPLFIFPCSLNYRSFCKVKDLLFYVQFCKPVGFLILGINCINFFTVKTINILNIL